MNLSPNCFLLAGTFLIFTGIPLGLYIFAKFGFFYAILFYLIYESLGYYLRFLAYMKSGIKKYSFRELLINSLKSSLLFIFGIIAFALLYALVKLAVTK